MFEFKVIENLKPNKDLTGILKESKYLFTCFLFIGEDTKTISCLIIFIIISSTPFLNEKKSIISD